jgi:hypothetical protein
MVVLSIEVGTPPVTDGRNPPHLDQKHPQQMQPEPQMNLFNHSPHVQKPLQLGERHPLNGRQKHYSSTTTSSS